MFCSEDQNPSEILCLAQYLGAIATRIVRLVKTGRIAKEELDKITYLAFLMVT